MRWLLLLAVLLVACGAKTGLRVPQVREVDAAGIDAPVTPIDASGVDAASCVSITATFRETIPTMVFVIDRSGSMTTRYIEPRGPYRGASRWGAVIEVLVGEGGILPGLEDRVRLGAITFTSSDTECPQLHSIAPALHNADGIADFLGSEGPDGGTPIAETMEAISTMLGALTVDGASPTLVLMTDGEPSGCGGGEGDPARAVARVFENGARTYVIGLGDDVGEPYLQSMANAGAGVSAGEPDAEFWPAIQATRFVAAIDTISRRVADCRATLSSPIDPRRACEAQVRLDGRLLACGGPDGWAALDDRTIELRGEACTTLVRDGIDSVTLEAPCDLRP